MRRAWLLFIAALLALPGGLAATLATRAERDMMLRGYVAATQTTALPYRLPRAGVNAELLAQDAATLRRTFELMQQANITWVRQMVRWNELEPERGVYRWQAWDRLVATLADYPALRLVPVLMHTPDWARPSTPAAALTAPPADPADLARFAAAFAQRYGHSLDVYQVWDEPNLEAAWGGSDPRPAEYAALLAAAYTAIHSHDAQATVIAAALAPTTDNSGQNLSDLRYLEALYALGAAAYFDAAAGKPYGFHTGPEDRTVHPETLNFSRLVALREIMVNHGDGHKALWASAWGWNALPAGWPGAPSIWGSVTAAQQVDYTRQAFARADREWPWAGGLILHHWQPAVPPDDPQWGFAVVDAAGTPTGLWHLLAARPPETARDGLYHPMTAFARYSGLWTFSQQRGADIGWLETSDSQLEFDFTGREVGLLLREDDYVAFLYPTVNGVPGNALPQDSSGNAYIFLQSDTRRPELTLVPVARDLPLAAHTLRVMADRGWDRWALAGYAVSSGDLAAPYNRQIAAGAFTTIIAALALIVTGRQIPWAQAWRPLSRITLSLSAAGHVALSAITSLALLAGMLLTWGDGTAALFRREALNAGAGIVLTGGLLILQPGFAAVLVAAALLFFLFYHRPLTGLLLTLLYAPFFLFPLALNQFAFPMAEVCLLLTTAAALLRGLVAWGRQRQSQQHALPPRPLLHLWLHRHPLDTGVLLWVAVGAVSLLWTQYVPQAVTELRTMLVEPALFYLLCRSFARSQSDLLRLADALLLSGVLVAGIGLALYARCQLGGLCIGVIEAEGGAQRLASGYGSPNNVGLWLGRCVPFALAYLLIALPGSRWRRWLAGGALVLLLVATLLTQSAGALLFGLPAGMGLVLLLVYGRRAWLPLTGLAAAAGALVLLLAQVSSRFAGLFLSERGTNFIRLRVWESSLEMIRHHPLTGLGLDQFLYFYGGQYIRPDAIADKDLSHPHNILLDFWLRLGIGGVLLLIALQIYFWRSLYALYRQCRHTDPVILALLCGTAGSMAALLAHGLIDNSVFVKDLAYVFCLLLALAVALPNARSIDGYPE